MKKYIAEAFGTFVLVFFGVGSAVLAGGGIGIENPIAITGISFAFGISVVAMAYSIGQVSGAHLNPAVSMGALVAGRMTPADFVGYAVGQTIGAIIAAFLIFIMAKGSAGGYDIANGLGQNGWGAGYGGEFFMTSAFIFEVVATAVFLVVILGVSIGPALFVGGTAMSQLWLFIAAPLIGGAIGGLLHKMRVTAP